MIIWSIKTENNEVELQLDKTTLLVGEHDGWYHIIRDIEKFFNSRNSNIEIYEDTQLLNQKDWDVLWIPFDTHLQFNKILAKSPVMPVLNDILEILELSPFYQNILEAFEELKEEQIIINNQIKKYDLQVSIRDFNISDMKEFIQLNPCIEKSSPIFSKQLLIDLFSEKIRQKRTLIILELPELFANSEQLIHLRNKLLQLTYQGVMVIILTNNSIFEGQKNFYIDKQIINDVVFDKLFFEIYKNAPFVINKNMYERAVSFVKQIVDNYPHSFEIQNKIDSYPQDIAALILIIKQHLFPSLNLTKPDFPMNIQNFLKSNH